MRGEGLLSLPFLRDVSNATIFFFLDISVLGKLRSSEMFMT
jgi:hypothetical protein